MTKFFQSIKKVMSFILEKAGFVRSERGIIAGVCAGIAKRLKINANIIRLIFIISTFFTFGLNILVYYILVKIMPLKINFADVNPFRSSYKQGEYIDVTGREL